ncbi:ThiF family adenylyltransferase [Paenibacillus athensensis]|uniref:THIF-type NAD/FAD binding fold domain-containing protein n=1 Tax=Paenibacillus athensensis TaxID=1967502 RepID=A0A4Y8PY31_9BACL|nr:ThiF family adenylyltransferase [Paenibacillus athensensis]MCD1258783.1 ThiF family adenylyltransferase [Paenibacillus athensensis]
MSPIAETYVLNPYTSILETERAFVINSVQANSLSFSKTDRAFVQQLLSRESWTREELIAEKGEAIAARLIATRVLLRPEELPPTSGRYSRQLGFFAHVTGDCAGTAERLRSASLLILGAGAIGSHVLWNMAAIGVREIAIVDYDRIEESNLNRQLMYDVEDIGRFKVDVLAEKLHKFNPDVRLIVHKVKLDSPEALEELVAGSTLVVKAIDTPERATEWLNAICVKLQIPYVSGGFIDFEGIVGPIYIPGHSLCAACLGSAGEVKKVAGIGPTFAPLTTAVASRMAMTAFRIMTGTQLATVTNKLFTYRTLEEQWETTPLEVARPCPECGSQPDPQPERVRRQQLKLYRYAVVWIAALAGLARLLLHTNAAGVVALLSLIVSLFFLKRIMGRQEGALQKELFNVSCIYGLIILTANAVMTLRVEWSEPGWAAHVLELMQAVCTYVLQAGIGITVILIILHVAMLGISALHKVAGRWAS